MRGDYRSHYLANLCRKNRQIFDSDNVWVFEPQDVPLDPRRRFSDLKHTFLEIGFGHGEVLEELAVNHPDIGFVGIERRPSRVKRALKRLQRSGAKNVQLLRINMELIDLPLFKPASFDRILVNHPDPWPKMRHEHHRFFRPDAADWFADVLASEGILEIVSDYAEYFFRILRLFEQNNRFESSLPPPFYTADHLPERPVSRYERKKRACGETVRTMIFKCI